MDTTPYPEWLDILAAETPWDEAAPELPEEEEAP